MQTKVELYKTTEGFHVHVYVHEDVSAEIITEYIDGRDITEFVFIVSDRNLFSIVAPTVKLLKGVYGNKVKYNLLIMSEPIPLRAGLYDYVLIADDYNKVKTVYMKIGGDEWNPAFADVTSKYMQENNNLLEEYDKPDYPTYYKIEE